MSGRKRPQQGRSDRPSTGRPAASPLTHLVHHPPPLRHHVEKALDHPELLHGQWLGLQGDSPDKEGAGGTVSAPTGLYDCPPDPGPFMWLLRGTGPPAPSLPSRSGWRKQGAFSLLGKLKPRKVKRLLSRYSASLWQPRK